MERTDRSTTAEERQLVPEPQDPSAGPPTKPIPRTQSIIQRPKTSPYSSPIVTLYIGLNKREYYVQRDLLQCPRWINACSDQTHPSIRIPAVDEDTGHVLVHFLHTGTYQTLDNVDAFKAKKERVEFKRAILAYFTARTYGLDGLQQLAIENIKHYGMEITTFDIFHIIDQEFPEFLEKSGWLYDYLKEKTKPAIEGDCILFIQSDFLQRVSNVELHRILFKCVAELYIASRISKSKVDRIEDGPFGEASVEEALVNAVEHRKKEEKAEAGRMKRQENEAVVAALVATGAANDLSWADPLAEATPADDGWGSFAPAATTGKKKKAKKGKQVTETVPLPPPGPELAPHTTDPATAFDNNDLDRGAPAFGLGGVGTCTSDMGSGWGAETSLTSGWGFDGGSSLGLKEKEKNDDEAYWDPTEKKGKKGAIAEIKEEPKVEEPPPPPPAEPKPEPVPEPLLVDDGWGSFAAPVAKKKKEKKSTKPVIAPEPVQEPEPEPEPILEAVPEPEPVAEVKKDDVLWGELSWGARAAAATVKKKKGKKGVKEDPQVEQLPPYLPLELRPETTPIVEEKPLEDGWGAAADDGWGIAAATVPKKEKKVKKVSIAAIPDPPREEPLIEVSLLREPVVEPPLDDDWGRFATPAITATKKGKKGKKSKKVIEESPPPSPPPVIPDLELAPPSTPSAECIPKPSDSTFTRHGTGLESPKGPENAVCLNRAQHLLEGDTWKDCRQCRAVLRKVAIELAAQVHENGYEMIDHLLIE